MEYKSIESIKYLEFFNDKSAEQTTLVFFHGYGANAKDLLFLKDFIKTDERIHWVFPEGTMKIPLGDGSYGQSWFQLDAEAFRQMHLQKNYEELALISSPHLQTTILEVDSFLKQLKKKSANLILGGFSQGGALALNLAFHKEDKPKALILFSAALINKIKLLKLSPTCKGIPFIQSHGEQDDILNYQMAKSLFSFLKEEGLEGDFVSFQGGHEVTMEVLEKTREFLNKVLKKD